MLVQTFHSGKFYIFQRIPVGFFNNIRNQFPVGTEVHKINNPVFFGETLYGGRIPNLTYMLGFESAEAMKEAWGKFGKHPEWQKLRKMDEYADSRVIRGITNIELKPTEYSQI